MQQTKESKLANDLRQEFDAIILEMDDQLGELTIRIDKSNIHSLCKNLRDNELFEFNQMMDVTAVDFLNQKRTPRFDVVYHLFSLTQKHRLRVKCAVEEHDTTIDSIHDLWLSVNWYERECYDMFGIHFNNHPKLERLLMYEGFEGHPLRKDYPILKEQPLIPLKEIEERYNYSDN